MKHTCQRDNPRHKDVLKIGKEICRMKHLDGADHRVLTKEFERDAQRAIQKKQDNTLTKEITKDVMRQLSK